MRTILGHNLMRMQADSQAKKIFQCETSGKKCTKGNVLIGNQERRLGPKLMLIIFKINDVLIIVNYKG